MILTITALKGGTGKTTTALALAQAAAADGRRVLMIDLDAQCNLSYAAGAAAGYLTSLDLLHGEEAGGNMIQNVQDVSIITGSKDLITESSAAGSALRLRDALKPLRRYDLIIIDTPSMYGELVFNALVASDRVLIPLKADTYSLQGLQKTLDSIELIRNVNKKLRVLGVILTEYDKRTTFGRFIFDQLQQLQSVKLLGTIRRSIAIQEAQNLRQSIFTYKPRCAAAADYLALYRLILLNKKE